MDALIETFHLDVKLIIAQAVNFTIVMLVLWFFALKPLIKIMQERTEKIEKSLEQAKEIEEKMVATDVKRDEVLDGAKKEALAVLEQAKKDSEANKNETLQKTKTEVEKLVAKGKAQLAEEKDKMADELKAEIGELVIEATKKVLGKTMSKDIDSKLVEEAVKEIK